MDVVEEVGKSLDALGCTLEGGGRGGGGEGEGGREREGERGRERGMKRGRGKQKGKAVIIKCHNRKEILKFRKLNKNEQNEDKQK